MMENYRKGKNVEEPLDKNKILIPNLPEDFLWMQVRGGTKIRNVLSHALEEFPKTKIVVWTGFGQAVGKTVTCAELMKKENCNKLHQITKICYRTVEEFWDPIQPEMDQIVVKRKLPMIHIVLSAEPLDVKSTGYQAPWVRLTYDPSREKKQYQNRARYGKSSQTPTKEFADMQMNGKNKKKKFRNSTYWNNRKSESGATTSGPSNKRTNDNKSAKESNNSS